MSVCSRPVREYALNTNEAERALRMRVVPRIIEIIRPGIILYPRAFFCVTEQYADEQCLWV